MDIRQIVTIALACVALFAAAGCDRNRDDLSIASETDEPYYRQGQQLVKQGRSQEALASYLKVIAKRGESAPESHLEAGLLYLDQVKDPLAAIYHFRKYLELQPNSRQAVYVRGRIDVAKREFARTLPAAPLESQAERLDMLEQVNRLQRENDELRAEVATLRGGVPVPSIRSRAVLNPAGAPATAQADEPPRSFFPARTEAVPEAAPETGESPISLALEPEPSRVEAAPVALTPAPRVAPTKPTAPAAVAGRRHIVVKGDTLFSLAQKYYGNRSRWRDIYAANRDLLPNENSLRLGMEIRIP